MYGIKVALYTTLHPTGFPTCLFSLFSFFSLARFQTPTKAVFRSETDSSSEQYLNLSYFHTLTPIQRPFLQQRSGQWHLEMQTQLLRNQDSVSSHARTWGVLAPRPRSVLELHGQPTMPIDTHKKPKKRTRDQMEDKTGNDHSNKRLGLMGPRSEPSYDSRGFACPFFKANHRKFDLKDSCARRSWPSIPRLKCVSPTPFLSNHYTYM